MSRGISLHIGLNQIDVSAYPDYTIPTLAGCINDANSMQAIANAAGFTTINKLIDAQATAMAVKNKIIEAASQLVNGDIFFLTYSGHGGQLPDETGQEEDGSNETWILYDRQLLDDELYAIWPQFAQGVRIFMLSDSCHSGTMAKFIMLDMMAQKRAGKRGISSDLTLGDFATIAQKTDSTKTRSLSLSTVRKRVFPAITVFKNYLKNKTLYQNIQQLTKLSKDVDSIKASLIFISGCQDNQLSGDGSVNGLFTGTLLDVWNNGAFSGDYWSFYERIKAPMPDDQTPNYMTLGSNVDAFQGQKPFTVMCPTSSNTNTGTTPATNTTTTNANPSVSGPATWSSDALPPTFNVNKGSNPLYYVEVATTPNLFNYDANGAQRSDTNFYATWNDASINYALFSTPQYQLPQEVWEKLKAAPKLYYRVGTTMDTQWNGWKITTTDADCAAAPFIQIMAANIDAGGTTPDSGNGSTSNGNGASGETPDTASGSRIQESVGASGANKPDDVRIIQQLLKQLAEADGGSPAISVDGLSGPGTIGAIKKFQRSNELNESGLFRPDKGSVILLYIKTQVITITYNRAGIEQPVHH